MRSKQQAQKSLTDQIYELMILNLNKRIEFEPELIQEIDRLAKNHELMNSDKIRGVIKKSWGDQL